MDSASFFLSFSLSPSWSPLFLFVFLSDWRESAFLTSRGPCVGRLSFFPKERRKTRMTKEGRDRPATREELPRGKKSTAADEKKETKRRRHGPFREMRQPAVQFALFLRNKYNEPKVEKRRRDKKGHSGLNGRILFFGSRAACLDAQPKKKEGRV